LLNGGSLVALAEFTAVTQTRTGNRQIHNRKRTEPGQVLPWELNGVIAPTPCRDVRVSS
jgi:hypothetical protein